MADQNEFEKASSAIEEINSIELYGKLFEDGLIEKSQTALKDDLYVIILTKGIVNKELSKDQVKIYLAMMTSEVKKKKIINLSK